jgi:DNA modification methylase
MFYMKNRIAKKFKDSNLGIGRDRASQHGHYVSSGENFPNSLLRFKSVIKADHPTQKPVALYEYLILTYTNPGETVLDICAGSGTTGEAAFKTGRNCILIERERHYFQLMTGRIARVQMQPALI